MTIIRVCNETRKLIELGFEYVTEIDGVKLFRKRKQGFPFSFFVVGFVT
jgi:hypothetical protein